MPAQPADHEAFLLESANTLQGQPEVPDRPVELLGTPLPALRERAARCFGADKGAGLAPALLAAAARTGTFSPERHGASAGTAARWRRIARLTLPEVAAEHSEPGEHGVVRKRRLRLADGAAVESVLLPMGRDRQALCVSTQVGCARACTFCETGRLGLRRNLTAAEITAQVALQWRERPPHTVVFQGMGEPLDNLDGLLPALRVLVDRHAFGLAHDKLTVCTVGHVPGIEALANLGWRRLGLSLSLNAANETLRRELMPHGVRYPLAAIQAALLEFRRRRNLALGVHWCLCRASTTPRATLPRSPTSCGRSGARWCT